MIKSYKIRLYPTKEQEQNMWKHIGACRFVWNYMLDLQQQKYKNGEKHLSQFDMIKCLPIIKNEQNNTWLKEISATTMQIVCSDLSSAYERFFNKICKFPKYKTRKRSKATFPTRSNSLWFNDAFVHVEKIGKLKYKTDFCLPFGKNNKFINPRIQNCDNKWILTFGIECENQAQILTDKPMGIDLGVKETMTVAYGNDVIIFHNINKSKKMRMLNKRLKHAQRSLSRKYEVNRQGDKYTKTQNIRRLELKVRKMYKHIANIRNDYIHQSTHKLVSLLPCKVVMEDISVSKMGTNKHMKRIILEQCFFEIIRQMKYKCDWNGIPFYQANRFYPSSKTCSCCGNIKQNLSLSERTYVCSKCGIVIDRDLNAAINLQRYVT